MHDVIVVGAGVAGGALINCLARDGRRVICVERSLYRDDVLYEPSRIVGELLQPGGYQTLCNLGLRDSLEGIDAQPIYGYGMFLGGRAEKIAYTDNDEVDRKPLVAGRSFHNGRFLRRLREIALDNPNITLVEGNVISLDKDADSGYVIGVTYKAANQTHKLRAPLTIACDGCSSTLRKRVTKPPPVSVYSKFYGLVLPIPNPHIPYPNHGHVILANPAPVLFYPISSHEVRCLVDVSSTYTGNVSDYMLTTVLPQIPLAFQSAFEAAVKAGGMKMMPNRVMPAPVDIISGAILLGDSFNMRHPLTGGGMTVALSDIHILRRLLRSIPDLSDTDRVSRSLQTFCQARKPLSTTINILANALYTLFCADDPGLQIMREACFDYLSMGGRMSNDPMSMLGGLKPHRFLLVAHFFSVALYGCGRALMPFPTLAKMRESWHVFRASFNIIKPLIDAERLTPLCWVPVTSL